jgi:hypothetical protein
MERKTERTKKKRDKNKERHFFLSINFLLLPFRPPFVYFAFFALLSSAFSSSFSFFFSFACCCCKGMKSGKSQDLIRIKEGVVLARNRVNEVKVGHVPCKYVKIVCRSGR